MAEDAALLEKRAELKRQLVAGEYRTLIDVILDGTGRLIQKLTRSPKPPPFWYNAVVIVLATLVISFLTSILLGEPYPLIRRDWILGEVAFVGLFFACVIAHKEVYIGILFSSLRDKLLDAIESVTDLVDLQGWLAAVCDVKKPLLLSLPFSFLFTFYGLIFISTIRGGFVGFGPTTSSIIVNFQGGMLLYYLLLFLNLPIRLSRYQFKLYAADPSSSEVIDCLSDMLNNFVYIVAVLAAILTLIFAFFRLLTVDGIILLMLVGWGPITIFFVINQYALTKIIANAKWKTLNGIQTKIEKLAAEENIADKEKMEAVNRLMDYHDRIKATRNSALDLRAGLNFLNSLLLPLLAFVLGNLDKILAYFS